MIFRGSVAPPGPKNPSSGLSAWDPWLSPWGLHQRNGSAGHVERQLVVEQLRSGGVIEALQVQRAGFPCRRGGAGQWLAIIG